MQVCPVAAKMPETDALDRIVEVRIVEHDVRRFAAELQRDALDPARRRFVMRWPAHPTPVKAIFAT